MCQLGFELGDERRVMLVFGVSAFQLIATAWVSVSEIKLPP
jgi:hypothetical protein